MISQVFDQTRLKKRFALARDLITSSALRSLVTNRKDLTNRRIRASLRKVGMATTTELKALEGRIEKLEAEIDALRAASSRP